MLITILLINCVVKINVYCCSVDMSMCANLYSNVYRINARSGRSGASSFNHWPRPLPRPLVTQPLGRTGWSNSGRSQQTPPSPRPPGIGHLLSGARETVSTVIHSEVQGDSGRGTTETVSSMPLFLEEYSEGMSLPSCIQYLLLADQVISN